MPCDPSRDACACSCSCGCAEEPTGPVCPIGRMARWLAIVSWVSVALGFLLCRFAGPLLLLYGAMTAAMLWPVAVALAIVSRVRVARRGGALKPGRGALPHLFFALLAIIVAAAEIPSLLPARPAAEEAGRP